MTNTATTLFSPVKLGDLELPNRFVMAPLTRSWAPTKRFDGRVLLSTC